MPEHARILTEALRLLVQQCPRLVRACYWAGTSSVALEELGHRDSFDIYLHTRRALVDVRPLQAEIRRAFPGAFEVVTDAGAGMGFSGVLTLPRRGSRVKRTVEFVRSVGTVSATTPYGETLDIPVVPGMLKHPRTEDLPGLLKDPDVVEKYTMEVLRKAPWTVVRTFPRPLLLYCLRRARLTEGRRRALCFMLSVDTLG